MATLITTCAALAACTPTKGPVVDQGAFMPEYGTITTKLLDGDLVSFDVEMTGARNDDDVLAFNDCAAAQYALIRGAGFVRRVRNDVTRKRDVWMGTGIYTLSEGHPGGVVSIDAEVTAAECRANNIPTV
ncbi:hypothetical protein [Amylibacter sp. IMCC11727]|uniref:hypothetical protein n=1 Tax=Amylibacter sp. IMCC11727 TaxID=3039851 RepID=UPI00244E3DC9|nr:hypothetical protein [Amylibacter sp. IMCC11727]WGI23400.1 hypothetical protein QBD29_08225 [Amylibacter sp. IMCC11727]